EHRKEWWRLERQAGPQPGETQEAFQKRMSSEEEFIKRQEQSLKQRQTDFELKAERQSAFAKAQLALQRGLAKKAVEILSDTEAAQLNRDEVATFITVLLHTGRVDEVYRDIGGNIPDDWNRMLLAAALGDYARTDD